MSKFWKKTADEVKEPQASASLMLPKGEGPREGSLSLWTDGEFRGVFRGSVISLMAEGGCFSIDILSQGKKKRPCEGIPHEEL